MKKMMSFSSLLGLLTLSSVLLTGCFAPLIVGGAAGGTMVATDRRTSGSQLEDQGIELRANSRINEVLKSRGHINITSYNRQVLLTGEVPSSEDKATAAQVAAKVENVKSVVNELSVLGNSSLASRSSDGLVTTRVKSALIEDKNTYANAFKITTERGVVYLMGLVTRSEADRATELARNQSGVQRVVSLFEIISPEELLHLQPGSGGKSALNPVDVGFLVQMTGDTHNIKTTWRRFG